jgi:hypothetical protein
MGLFPTMTDDRVSSYHPLVLPWLLLHLLYQRLVGRDLQSHVHNIHRCCQFQYRSDQRLTQRSGSGDGQTHDHLRARFGPRSGPYWPARRETVRPRMEERQCRRHRWSFLRLPRSCPPRRPPRFVRPRWPHPMEGKGGGTLTTV